ncbi:hypothetical protein ANANG_G00018810 [Anguilla anguilla]|uniref:Uncharacterized protein n=1 Tax=Anguilla anguilla TaxID=7936 RepID=A0A9D3N0Y9_ANGAN|nr:hypothetical protein ANANG_G00018810 [Anguilla anguilla]
MAPVAMLALGWTAARSLSPELILAALLCLIALIKFLAICSQCNRETFEPREPSQTEKSPSSLIQVVNLEDTAMSRENPCFEYVAKDEQVPRPTSQRESTQVSMESGQVWYTPWRSHTNSLNHQDHMGNSLNHEPNPAESPARAFARAPTPSGVAATPLQEGASMWLPSAHSEISSRPRDAPIERVRPLWQSETREDNGGVPESSTGSVPQHWIRAQHTYESLEDLRPVTSEERESNGYQTVEEFNASVPYLSDSMRRAGSDLLSPPTADEGVEEWMMGMGPKAMYAQVSKKCKNPAQPSHTLPEGEEPVPLPNLLLEEEEEPAPPPVPDRNFEM